MSLRPRNDRAIEGSIKDIKKVYNKVSDEQKRDIVLRVALAQRIIEHDADNSKYNVKDRKQIKKAAKMYGKLQREMEDDIRGRK
jgi:uncharacterized protein HemY